MVAADLSDLPAACLEAEEFGCLHDKGAVYAQALQTAGVEVHLKDVPGIFHGFDFITGKRISQVMIPKQVQAPRQVFPIAWSKR